MDAGCRDATIVVSARFHDFDVATPKVMTFTVDAGCRDANSISFGTILMSRCQK